MLIECSIPYQHLLQHRLSSTTTHIPLPLRHLHQQQCPVCILPQSPSAPMPWPPHIYSPCHRRRLNYLNKSSKQLPCLSSQEWPGYLIVAEGIFPSIKETRSYARNMSQMALASSRSLAETPRHSLNPTKLCASPWYPHGMANPVMAVLSLP